MARLCTSQMVRMSERGSAGILLSSQKHPDREQTTPLNALVSRPPRRPALTDLRLRSRRRRPFRCFTLGGPPPDADLVPARFRPCQTLRLGPSGTSSFLENLSLKALSSALQRARPEPSAENRQPSRFAAIRPSSPERIFFDDLIFNPSRSASTPRSGRPPVPAAPVRPRRPPGIHARPSTSSVPPDAPRPQRPLTEPRPEPPSTGLLRQKSPSIPENHPANRVIERMMQVVIMKAFSARQMPLRQEIAAETRRKNRGLH